MNVLLDPLNLLSSIAQPFGPNGGLASAARPWFAAFAFPAESVRSSSNLWYQLFPHEVILKTSLASIMLPNHGTPRYLSAVHCLQGVVSDFSVTMCSIV